MNSLGILGGGQLARFLALKAQDLKIKSFVLSPCKQDPAVPVCSVWIKGDPFCLKDLSRFLPLVQVVTFESEFFPAKRIQKLVLSLEKGKRPLVAPSLKALSLLQDRRTQKKLLLQHNIPTADFVSLNRPPDLPKLRELWEHFEGPFVLKKALGGYDGKGTFVVKSRPRMGQLKLSRGAFIAEKFVPFQRELAVLAVRRARGQMVFFPLVESFQKEFRCLWVKGPICADKKWQRLKMGIKKLLEALAYQGVMAFELFDTGTKWLVNETAPRVHNSGHYSLDALSEDQFTAHIKAIFNQPLKSPRLFSKGFAMLNLLGEGVKRSVLPQKKAVQLYWYEKSVSHKGRKMGHLNSLASSPDLALRRLLKARPFFKA